MNSRSHSKVALTGKLGTYLGKIRVARLATQNKDGTPHIVPIVFANDSHFIYFVIDSKPKKSIRLRRIANIERNSRVTLLLDRYSENWNDLSYMIIYAEARILSGARNVASRKRAIKLLKEKYAQYKSRGFLPKAEEPMIVVRIIPKRAVFWSASR